MSKPDQKSLYQESIELCYQCAQACDACAVACLSEENAAYMRDCILADIDCAAFCRLTAGFMARDSQLVQLIAQDCAEICQACAEQCSQHPAEHCQQCAQACMACAEACLRIGTAKLEVAELV